MTAVFAVPLTIGVIALLGWIAAVAMSSMVEGFRGLDPEERFGPVGRLSIAGLIGFGMAGISALYAGWASPLAVIAGVAGAVGLGAAAHWLGPAEDG